MKRLCRIFSCTEYRLARQRFELILLRIGPICLAMTCGMMLSACVVPMTMEEQSPDLDYLHDSSIVISVIDERSSAQRETPETYIGSGEGAFGKVTSLQTYPWFVANEEKRNQALSDALEERIVFGLNDEGWDAVPASFSDRPSSRQAKDILRGENAENLLVLTLKKWDVNANLNWITPINFDWEIMVTVMDRSGNKLLEYMDSGTDIVDEERDRSIADHIRLAYRQRLISILEGDKIRTALRSGSDRPTTTQDKPALASDDIEPVDHDHLPAIESSVLVDDGAEVALDEPGLDSPDVDSKEYLLGQLKMLQFMLDSGTISQQEYTDLVRGVVDGAGNPPVE